MKTSIRTVALQLVMEESQSAQYGNKAQSPAATFFDSGDVDRVLGGAGRDILRGQAGDDRLEGGEEADFLYGWEGDDKLLAEADLSLEEALAQGESGPGSTDRGDFLQGNAGRDTVIGGIAKDLISGGEGEDILVGGAGDDLLSGDDQYSAFSYDWSVERTVETDPDGGTTYRYTVSGASGTQPAGSSDALYGGAGADWLFGNEGDDFIDGGADDDVAFGEEGADTLLGGEGSDVLVGDSSVEALAEALHGDDFIDGGAGDDEINGDGGSDLPGIYRLAYRQGIAIRCRMRTAHVSREWRVKSQSAQYGDKSQSPEDGAAAAANDSEWRRVA